MTTPDFVLSLRERIGHAPLPLVGVTAVVFRGEHVLLGRRADNGTWRCVSGIVDPGEEPADAAVRECLEEADVRARATRLVLVEQIPRNVYANGDQVDYLGLVFRCEWVSGEPRPADGELTEVGWFGPGELDRVEASHRREIELATAEQGPASFHGGGHRGGHGD